MKGETEARFLARYAEERPSFPRAEHTVDVALFTIREGQLCIALIRRAQHPTRGRWALPGGFVELGGGSYGEGEDLETAARRELAEETGLDVFPGYLEQLRTYADPWRDKRGRVISTAYVALTPHVGPLRAGDDAGDAHYFAVADLDEHEGPELAFDHQRIIEDALERVRGKIEYEGRLAASFLTEPFTIGELRRVYEAVWGGTVSRGNFVRKVLSSQDFLVPTGDRAVPPAGRPAALYRLGVATQFNPPMTRATMQLAKGTDVAD